MIVKAIRTIQASAAAAAPQPPARREGERGVPCRQQRRPVRWGLATPPPGHLGGQRRVRGAQHPVHVVQALGVDLWERCRGHSDAMA